MDTSIPINCQVLASTFYLEVDEPQQATKKHYLFELIQDKDIWKNVQFWERTISQYIQNDIIDQLDHEDLLSEEDKPRDFAMTDEQLQKVIDIVFTKLTQIQHDMASFNIPSS